MQRQYRGYSIALWVLLLLFCFRVIAQYVQLSHPVSFLPAFSQWQGGSLPYSWLLSVQLAMIAAMAAIALRVGLGQAAPRRALGRWLLFAGGVYFAVMALRLALGLTALAHIAWFAKTLPAFFHLVLASYLLVLAHYHRRAPAGPQ